MGVKVPNSGSFKKGVSGNPGGRSKEWVAVHKKFQEKGPRAFEILVDIMENSEDEKIRLMAAERVLERAYGKPKQETEISGVDGGALKIVVEVREK